MENLYDTKEVANYFKVRIETVWRWLREGSLDYVQVGGKKMVTEQQLQDFIKKESKNER